LKEGYYLRLYSKDFDLNSEED